MSFASRHNKGTVFNIDTTGFIYQNAESLYKNDGEAAVYTVDGLYINRKGKFEDHPVAIVSEHKYLVDLPPHMTDDVTAILSNEEDIEDIKAGNAKFIVEPYTSKKYNRLCYGIKWV